MRSWSPWTRSSRSWNSKAVRDLAVATARVVVIKLPAPPRTAPSVVRRVPATSPIATRAIAPAGALCRRRLRHEPETFSIATTRLTTGRRSMNTSSGWPRNRRRRGSNRYRRHARGRSRQGGTGPFFVRRWLVLAPPGSQEDNEGCTFSHSLSKEKTDETSRDAAALDYVVGSGFPVPGRFGRGLTNLSP